MKEPYHNCPRCGSMAVVFEEWQVQEFDLESLNFKPSEMLQESECLECSWSVTIVTRKESSPEEVRQYEWALD